MLTQSPEPKAHDKELTIIQIELEFGNVAFLRREENQSKAEKKLSEQGITNASHIMPPGAGIEPGTHGWEASALTTAPSVLPIVKC